MSYESRPGNTARPTEYIRSIDEDTAVAFDAFRDTVMKSGPLDLVQCEMIITSGLASTGMEQPFKTHCRRLIDNQVPKQALYQMIPCATGATMTFPQAVDALHWIDELWSEPASQ